MRGKSNSRIGNVALSETEVAQEAMGAGTCKDMAVEGRDKPALWFCQHETQEFGATRLLEVKDSKENMRWEF